jgi:hypothetical protein
MRKAAFWICLSVTTLALTCARAGALEDRDRMSIMLLPRDLGGPEQVRARDFLWQHWRQKKPGLLEVASCTREGVRHEWRYEVIIQENAPPAIAVTGHTRDDGSCPIAALAVPAGTTLRDIPREPESFESFKISTVERIRRIGKSDEVANLAPEKALPATKYRLRFKDQKGEILGTF